MASESDPGITLIYSSTINVTVVATAASLTLLNDKAIQGTWMNTPTSYIPAGGTSQFSIKANANNVSEGRVMYRRTKGYPISFEFKSSPDGNTCIVEPEEVVEVHFDPTASSLVANVTIYQQGGESEES